MSIETRTPALSTNAIAAPMAKYMRASSSLAVERLFVNGFGMRISLWLVTEVR